ncbi:Gfo/Idh/MocA family oxidoreductase [Telmatospirillum sp.]|uniref:Gfo/Idh/MocA family protein n=1 Tax=Telmatospirillum sp. TaxID=2079197 RepID=UPI0028504A6C|nr:Gfo/Idh/MocA family oxidoreductase [Telmatospirillum sp.]MDR3440181.1 Gfo/Idh/MocA family oxidoreductase [Telmatospirillum sp.]
MKTVRWGMIGCGAVTEVKSGPGFYKAERSALLAVTSADPAMTRSFAERHKVPKAYDSVEALLADPDIDAVYIATPPAFHKPLALQAARAGKHVYVEKPMALRHAECQQIIDDCAKLGRRLFVAYYRRAMPRFLQVKQWLDDGVIGDIRCVTAVQHQPPAPEDLSRATLPWRLKPEVAGGGKFLDMAVHTLDLFDFLFGPVVEAYGIATNQGGYYDVEDTVTATWRHAGGVQGSGSWCYVCADDRDRVEIIGTKGCIEMEFFSDAPLHLVTAERDEMLSIANPAHVQQPFIQSIVDELTGTGRCPGDPDSAARASWVADKILAGYRKEEVA